MLDDSRNFLKLLRKSKKILVAEINIQLYGFEEHIAG
jgi:hypothetical protein